MAQSANSIWAKEGVVDRLIAIWTKGHSAAQCAAMLAAQFGIVVTRNSVIAKIDRINKAKSGSVLKRSSHAKHNPRSKARPPAKSSVPRAAQGARWIAPTPNTMPKAPPSDLASTVDDQPMEKRKSLVDLRDSDCRWPIGDPQHDDFRFCSAGKLPGLPYCQAHAQRAYPARAATRDRFSEREGRAA